MAWDRLYSYTKVVGGQPVTFVQWICVGCGVHRSRLDGLGPPADHHHLDLGWDNEDEYLPDITPATPGCRCSACRKKGYL